MSIPSGDHSAFSAGMVAHMAMQEPSVIHCSWFGLVNLCGCVEEDLPACLPNDEILTKRTGGTWVKLIWVKLISVGLSLSVLRRQG